MQRKIVANRTTAIVSSVARIMVIILVIGFLANVAVMGSGRSIVVEAIRSSASRAAMQSEYQPDAQTDTVIWLPFVIVDENSEETGDLDPEGDADGDGLPNQWESAHQLNPQDATGDQGAAGDPDGDELSNIDEYYNATDPQSADTDSDGMPDLWEIEHSLDPVDATGDNGNSGDLDGDSVSNGDEYVDGTDPSSSDTDQDGIPDGDAHYARRARTADGQMDKDAPDGEPYPDTTR